MIDYALKYDTAVINHKIITGHDIQLACKIDLMNRRNVSNHEYPYYYDKNIVDKYIQIAKVISKYELAPFQLWYLSIITGWRFKRDPKIKRYNQSILSMARKNAKSYLTSVALVTELISSELKGDTGKQFYICASKKAQAMLSLRTCRELIKRLQVKSELARNFKLNRDIIYSTMTGSYIQALPSRASSLDGLRVDGCVLDECHSLRDSKLKAVLQSATMQSPNATIFMTSTSGFRTGCPFHYDWKIAESELRNLNTKSRSFNAIYTQDNKNEIYKDPTTWIKSNPLMAVPDLTDSMNIYLKDQLDKAAVSGRSNSVLVKNFNRWGNTHEQSFISPDKWKSNTVKPINLTGKSNVVLGLDLARIHDMTAISLTVPLNDGRYYTTTHAFISDNNIQKKSKADNINYLELEKDGYVTISRHSYGLIDFRLVVQYIVDLIRKYHIKRPIIAFDPWQSGDVVNMLGDYPNINLIKVSQSIRNLSEVIESLYRLILSHKLVHDDNPLYEYSFANLHVEYNIHGNIYLDKNGNGNPSSTNRIDPVFALLDSLKIQKSLNKKNKKSILSKQLEDGDFIF